MQLPLVMDQRPAARRGISKVKHINEINNFVVDDFFIGNYLLSENSI